MRTFAILTALLLSACVTIQPTAVGNSDMRDVVVAVQAADYDSATGFAIAPNLVLTNAHVAKVPRLNHVVARDGVERTSRPIWISKTADLAVLFVAPALPAVAELRCDRPAFDEEVYAIGFPGYARWAKYRGRVASTEAPAWPPMDRVPQDMVALDLPVDSGLSGSPLFDEEDRVVGVILGAVARQVGVFTTFSQTGLAVPGDVVCAELELAGLK